MSRKFIPVSEVAKEWFKNPDFVREYDALEEEFALASAIIGRVVMKPGELQVGVVTAFVGAPVLIALVRRKKASGL